MTKDEPFCGIIDEWLAPKPHTPTADLARLSDIVDDCAFWLSHDPPGSCYEVSREVLRQCGIRRVELLTACVMRGWHPSLKGDGVSIRA